MKPLSAGKIAFFLGLVFSTRALLFGWPADDDFYPKEESAERSRIVWPRLVELLPAGAVVEWPRQPPQSLRVGETYHQWELLAVIPQPTPLAVLERNFCRWGVVVYSGTAGPVATVRKSVGRLDVLRRGPAFALGYFDGIVKAQEDVLGVEATADEGEPSYQILAGLLPPLSSYTILGTTTSADKVIVWPDGRLGAAIRRRHLDEILFDPMEKLNVPRSADFATKQGLMGGYLPVIDYGFFDANIHSGWEEIAFSTGNEKLQTFVSLRTNNGIRSYWRLPGPTRLGNGTDVYRNLLNTQRTWECILAQGMTVTLPEARVSDSSHAAIVRGLISEAGPHPKYGVGVYSASQHDSFPPATILPSWCWLDWGFAAEAKARIGYYLSHFVKPDGTFDYYGPALSEYGQILTLVARCVQVTGDTNWLRENLPPVRRIANSLLAQLDDASRRSPGAPGRGLLWGSAEADTHRDKRYYFASDVWCWRGLQDLGQVLTGVAQSQSDPDLARFGTRLLVTAAPFRTTIMEALRASFQPAANPPFLPPAAGQAMAFDRMTESELASYTNYRYWPEMLSAGALPDDLTEAVINYRTAHGGEVAATTRLEDVMDDWPYAHYAWGLLDAGLIRHYLLGFYGHLAYHQTPGTFTAYESVAIRGARTRDYGSDYCVPAQMVGPQLLRWMIAWEPWDARELWLGRGVPKRWFEAGFAARQIPTRWGPVQFDVVPAGRSTTAKVRITSPHADLRVHLCFRSIVDGSAARVTVDGTKSWSWDPRKRVVDVWGDWREVTVSVGN